MSAFKFNRKELEFCPLDWARKRTFQVEAVRNIFIEQYDEKERNDFFQQVSTATSMVSLVMYHRQVIGFVATTIRIDRYADVTIGQSPDHFLIEALAVTSRFTRRGVGRMLLRHAFSSAKRLWLSDVRIFVPLFTEGVRRFLSVFNFRLLPEDDWKAGQNSSAILKTDIPIY